MAISAPIKSNVRRPVVPAELIGGCILLVVLFTSLIARSPVYMQSLDRDAGVYQYIGWRMLSGDIPYRDVWDHKPPVIFFLNALAFKIIGVSEWSVWILEAAFAILFVILLYVTVSRLFSWKTAFLVSLFGIFSLTQLGLFNTPELYALPLEMAIVYIFLHGSPGRSQRNDLLMGILGAICLFTKQTTIGMFLVVALWPAYELLTRQISSKQAGLTWMRLLFGFAIPTAFVFLYLYSNAALETFWSAAFVFNLAHVKCSFMERIDATISGLDYLRTFTGISLFALTGWFISLMHLVRKDSHDKRLFFLITLGMILEIALTGTSCYKYNHYYLTLIPIFCLSSAVVIHAIDEWMAASGQSKRSHWIILLVLLLSTQLSSSSRNYYWPFVNRAPGPRQQEIVDYIDKKTNPEDHVLLLGAETGINYLARRESPTRFVYQYPLAQRSYLSQGLLDEFFHDIQKNKPRLVIDTKNTKILTSSDYDSAPLYSLLRTDFFTRSCALDTLSTNMYEWDIYVCEW